MSHGFHVPDKIYAEIASFAAQRGQTPDALLMALVRGGVELLKQVDATASPYEAPNDQLYDPLTPFIGAFDSGDDPGWVEQHDKYFARAVL